MTPRHLLIMNLTSKQASEFPQNILNARAVIQARGVALVICMTLSGRVSLNYRQARSGVDTIRRLA